MPGLNVNFNEWPIWLLFLLMVINILKTPISAILPETLREWGVNPFKFRAEREMDRREHQQEIEQALVNSRLQAEATDALRKSWREEQWAEILQQMLAWLREDLQTDLKNMQATQTKQQETLVQVQKNTARTNDLLTTMNMTLSLLAERSRGRSEG